MLRVAMWAEGPIDRIERHLERYRDEPGDSTGQPNLRPPAAPAEAAVGQEGPIDATSSGGEGVCDDLEPSYKVVAEDLEKADLAYWT